MGRGERRHLISLDNPGAAIPDGDGGFTQAWTALTPATRWAEIKPASARDLERVAGASVISTATHIVTFDYHSGVTTKTRITKGPRNADGTLPSTSQEFSVTGTSNPEMRNIDTVALCVEIVP
jgi:head-tail adaptor